MTPIRRLIYAIIAPIGVTILRLLWLSYRFDLDIDDEVLELNGESKPVVLSFWHDSIFICSYVLRKLARQGLRVTFLVSPSADGKLAVRMLGAMGWHAVRGSATRSGVKAMHGLYRAVVRRQESPVVVPDGPQGPRRESKLGSVLLARLAGIKIVPIGGSARSVWHLKTWDRLQIPRPFTKVSIRIGKPFEISNDGSEEENKAKMSYLDEELNHLSLPAGESHEN